MILVKALPSKLSRLILVKALLFINMQDDLIPFHEKRKLAKEMLSALEIGSQVRKR